MHWEYRTRSNLSRGVRSAPAILRQSFGESAAQAAHLSSHHGRASGCGFHIIGLSSCASHPTADHVCLRHGHEVDAIGLPALFVCAVLWICSTCLFRCFPCVFNDFTCICRQVTPAELFWEFNLPCNLRNQFRLTTNCWYLIVKGCRHVPL